MILWYDCETFNVEPISVGSDKYSETVEQMIHAYAFDDESPKVWDSTVGGFMPVELVAALLDPSVNVIAHNSRFDRLMLRSNFPDLCPPIERWRDTMIMAMAHSLPAGLAKLCEVLGVPSDSAKDADGKKLIQLFCKPRSSKSKIRRATAETHPKEWAKFVAYATQDIVAMRECYRRLPKWNMSEYELSLWHLDQRINDRGLYVDLELANAAVRATQVQQIRLASEIGEATNGEVAASTQRNAMLKHIQDVYGLALPDLQASTLEKYIGSGQLPQELVDLLNNRLQASTTSTAKYNALVNATNSDGRLRGTLQFCGASRTGRWSGRTFQPQNLPRPSLEADDIEVGIEALKAGCEDLFAYNVMELISSAIRGCIVASKGKKLVVADLSNIEGRMLAWIAKENWKLEAFEAFDLGCGHDLYKLAYAKSFGVPPEKVTKEQRQVGKVQELAFGYQGAVGAWVTFATGFGIDLEAMAEKAHPQIPKQTLIDSTGMREWARQKKMPSYGLTDKTWIVCDAIKALWREAHSNTAAFWKDIEEKAISATLDSGSTYYAGKRKFPIRRDGTWLRIRMPSGRYLCYPGVQVDDSGKLSYMGFNQYTRKWDRLYTYGGKLTENLTQAMSRDVLAYSMPLIEAADYEIVLTVHDEIISEAPDTSEYNVEHLAHLMSTVPPWVEGLPLAAAGFETYRYRKE